MKDNYTFSVILDFNEENVINIIFPDFENAITCADIDEDYITVAQDYLALTITDYEDSNKEIPVPLLYEKLSNGQKLVYINVWMPYHRSKVKEIFIKKTLTIPSWLDILAKNNNINFSSVLVKALKNELDIK